MDELFDPRFLLISRQKAESSSTFCLLHPAFCLLFFLRLHLNSDMALPASLTKSPAHGRWANPPPIFGWTKVDRRVRNLESVNINRHIELIGLLLGVSYRRSYFFLIGFGARLFAVLS